jgi:ATP-binding protein involved in chromosome partitioning
MTETNTPTEAEVLQALRVVEDPDLRKDIVALGFVKNVKICGDTVAFDVELTTPACPVKDKLRDQARAAVEALPGVKTANVNMTARVTSAMPSRGNILQGVKNAIAISSGKGGVGKSTVAVNLALALAKTGARVGLMDADVYGPSVPTLLGGADARPTVDGERILPIERHGIAFMSMGLLTGKDTPVIWRGPMATRLIQQFLGQVQWGELDYLLIDLPPGTGDVQLTLTQAAPLTGAVVVTTPQDLAVGVTLRGLRMFEQVQVPILGLVENMSYFACPHCQERTDVFRTGGGEQAAKELGYPFLGAIPLDPALSRAGDAGVPLVARDDASDTPACVAFGEIAKYLAARISVVNDQTASMLFHPKQVRSEGRDFVVEWSDGEVTKTGYHELRLACPCALCVDEWTGERRVTAGDVSEDVDLAEVKPVGRYALNLVWSDGHATGIYSFDHLRSLAAAASAG